MMNELRNGVGCQVAEAGCYWGQGTCPQQVGGMMAHVIEELFAEGIGCILTIFTTTIAYDVVAILQVPAY